MEYIIDQSLKKVAKGSGIVFIGLIIGTVIGALSRILIARYYTTTKYGIYSLALVLFSLFAIVSTLGLDEGMTRQISYFRGQNELKVRGVISFSLQITIFVSLILSAILFLSSNVISTRIFHIAELSKPLKIVSIAIPFNVLILISMSIFRGFDRVEVKAYFNDILRTTLFLFSLVVIVVLNLSFIVVFYALVVSFIATFVAFAVYAMRSTLPIKMEKNLALSPVRKELLLFSLPLLIVVLLNMVFHWGDTLLLAYFKTPNAVGLYNAAYPLAVFVHIIPSAVAFIYVPVASQLYSKNLIKEVGRTYQVITKWVFSASLPIFLILFLFPGLVLDFLFGPKYVSASLALRILTLGFMFNVFLGLNGLSLLVLGKTRLIMFTSLAGALTNIVLDIILIPPYGIEGAAVASAFSYFIVNLLNSIKLYQISKIHPFSKNYLKPVGIAIILLVLIYFSSYFFKIKFWILPILLIVYLLGYFTLLLLTRSFDIEDINLFLALEKNLGVNFTPIKKMLKKLGLAVGKTITEKQFISIASGEIMEVAEMQEMFAKLAKPEMPEAPKEPIIVEDVDIGSFWRKIRELFKP